MNQKIKGAFKSKTIWLAVLMATFGAILATLPMLEESISPEWYGIITMIFSVWVAILRVFTTLPLDQK